jgi:CBS domain containing-hemolysin-like protein
MSETAFSSASDSKLKIAVENKVAGAKRAIYLYERFDKTVTTLLIGNNLVNVALSTIAVIFFTQLAFSSDANLISLITTLVITLTLLIFGEIVPKMIAKVHSEAVCTKVAWIVYILSLIFYPFVMLFVLIQRLITRNRTEETTIEKEELNVIIDELENTGEIENNEADVLHNVLDLGKTTVEDIMVPRIKMEAIDYDSTLEEVKAFMLDNAFSRVPVYKKDKDHVVGILYERDFFPAYVKNPKLSWRRLIRPVKYVSGAMKADDLIKDMQISKTHLAVVSGEYGETLGIVTMEDALEELVGEIYDEHDIPGGNDIRFEKQEDGSYIVDAEIFVEDLFDRLEIGDVPEDVPSKISGWLFEKCESLPVAGFEIEYLASYTKLDDETNEYKDYNKLLKIQIYEVKNRAITLSKVIVRDATQEEIASMKKEEE